MKEKQGFRTHIISPMGSNTKFPIHKSLISVLFFTTCRIICQNVFKDTIPSNIAKEALYCPNIMTDNFCQ